MPELPEVETVKNELLPHVVAKRITDVVLFWDGMVRAPSPEKFRRCLVGQVIVDLRRRGKYLIFELSGGEHWVVHLKMSGSLLLLPASDEPGRFVRAVVGLDSGGAIHFRDPRKFGVMWLVADEGEVVGRLGPEPLGDSFSPPVLAGILAKRTAPVKAVLLDQTLIAGIGNMYADEALFKAKLHPLRPGKSLSGEEVERLYDAIIDVLRAAIGDKGASIENYYRPDGTTGRAHYGFSVAHRRGRSCPVCGTPLARILVRNRGSYLCPCCQPLA